MGQGVVSPIRNWAWKVQVLHPFQLKESLLEMITATGRVIHEPYVTTKHGKLRSKRKSNNEPISATDDLATLENLEEVSVKALCFFVQINAFPLSLMRAEVKFHWELFKN